MPTLVLDVLRRGSRRVKPPQLPEAYFGIEQLDLRVSRQPMGAQLLSARACDVTQKGGAEATER